MAVPCEWVRLYVGIMTVPAISVIIINFNSGDRLAKCLAHLGAQTRRDFEIIVFDNASSDGSAALDPDRIDLPLRIERSPDNLGFAAGNNRAVKFANAEWVAFLNPDAYAEPDWLARLMAAREQYPWADAFGSTQIDANDPACIDGCGDVYHAFGIPWRGGFGQSVDRIPPDGEVFSPCAAAALYRRSTFEALGGFDETFFCYGEDVDLGFRLRLAGGRCVQVRDAIVYHEGSAVSGRYSDFTVYHGNRNRIWGWFKNMPIALLVPLLPFQVAANIYLLVRSFTVGIGKPYWRAMIDGYGGVPRVWVQRGKTVPLGRGDDRGRIIVRALTWDPVKITQRAVDVRPVSECRS